MNNMTQALILLLAGFLVVFVVLILLIIVVSLYSNIISGIQKKRHKTAVEEPEEKISKPGNLAPIVREEPDDDEIPDEIIAVIAAAVDAVYGSKPHKIKTVKRSRTSRSAWARAGLADNTRPF